MQAVASLQKNSLPTLTPRQKQIAYLVSQGLSNPAIAREVFLTEGGV
ncbi:MAG: LuxR C-terminal-related transcriptional regulator, partial [Chroococcidiopsis sp.]